MPLHYYCPYFGHSISCIFASTEKQEKGVSEHGLKIHCLEFPSDFYGPNTVPIENTFGLLKSVVSETMTATLQFVAGAIAFFIIAFFHTLYMKR